MFFFGCVSCWHCIVSDGHHYGQSLHCFGVFILDGVAKNSVQWLGSVHQKVYGYEPLATWIHTLKVVAVHECKFTPTVSFFTSCLHFNLPSCICVCPNTAPNHALNFRGAYRRKGRWWFAPGSFGSRPRQFLVWTQSRSIHDSLLPISVATCKGMFATTVMMASAMPAFANGASIHLWSHKPSLLALLAIRVAEPQMRKNRLHNALELFFASWHVQFPKVWG